MTKITGSFHCAWQGSGSHESWHPDVAGFTTHVVHALSFVPLYFSAMKAIPESNGGSICATDTPWPLKNYVFLSKDAWTPFT